MISTAQIAQTPRPAAAPLMAQNTASDLLASDAFSDVLALVAADPAAPRPLGSPDRQPQARPLPDLTSPDQTLPVPQPLPHHRHPAHLKPSEPQMAFSLTDAILDLPVKIAAPAVLPGPDLRPAHPLQLKGDPLSHNPDPTMAAEKILPLLQALQLPFLPTIPPIKASTVADALSDAQPISAGTAEERITQGPQASRDPGQSLMAAPSGPTVSAPTANPGGETVESTNALTPLLPTSDPITRSIAGTDPPAIPPQPIATQASDGTSPQPQTNSASGGMMLTKPVQHPVAATFTAPERQTATPNSPAASSAEAAQPPSLGPALTALNPATPAPEVPAAKHASAAQFASQVNGLAPHAPRASQPRTQAAKPEPAARLNAVVQATAPQGQSLPLVQITQVQPAAAQGLAQAVTKASGLVEVTLPRPLLHPALVAAKSPLQPVPAPLPASHGASKLPVQPLNIPSARAPQSMPAPKTGEGVPPPEGVEVTRGSLAYQILIPSQAFSRFQTMLDRTLGEGPSPKPALIPTAETVLTRPNATQITVSEDPEPTPVVTTAQSMLTLRAQPDRMVAPPLGVVPAQPDQTTIPTLPASSRHTAGPIVPSRTQRHASLTDTAPIMAAIKPLATLEASPENATSPSPVARDLPTRTEIHPAQSSGPIGAALHEPPKPATSLGERLPSSAVSKAESQTAWPRPVPVRSPVNVKQTPEPGTAQRQPPEPDASDPVTLTPNPSRPASAKPADAPLLTPEPARTWLATAGSLETRPGLAPQVAARLPSAIRPEVRLLQDRPAQGNSTDTKSMAGAIVLAVPARPQQAEAIPQAATQVRPETDLANRAVTAPTISRPEVVAPASRMILPIPVNAPLQTVVPAGPKPSEPAPKTSPSPIAASLTTALLGTVPQALGQAVPAPTPIAPASDRASEPDLAEVMGLSRPTKSQPERPTRRNSMIPGQSLAKGPSQTPAPVNTLQAAAGTAAVPTLGSATGQVAGHGPPIVDDRAAEPAVQIETNPAVPRAGHFAPSAAPVQAHMVAAPSHPAAPAEHAHHSLPKGFSSNLAHSVLDSGHSRAELILEPAELGRLRFDLVTTGDQVQVNLSAERPETLDLLRRHADELRQEFRASGLDTCTLSFGQWGKGAGDRAVPDQPGAEIAPDDPLPFATLTLSTSRRPVSGSGLDLRL